MPPKRPSSTKRPGIKGGGASSSAELPVAPFRPVLNERDAYPWLLLQLNKGQGVVVQNGCLAHMDGFLTYDTQNVGGVWQGVQRLFSQGSFFMNVVKNDTDAQGTVAVSSPCIGSIQEVTLSEGAEGVREYIFNEQSVIAFTSNVEVSATLRFQGVFAGGPIFQHAKLTPGSGSGKVWISTFGNLSTIKLAAGQSLKIDNDYFVGCNASTAFGLSTFSPAAAGMLKGITNFLITPYAFVFEFTGPATVHVQTKSLKRFANQLAPFMPAPSSSSSSTSMQVGDSSVSYSTGNEASSSGAGGWFGWLGGTGAATAAAAAAAAPAEDGTLWQATSDDQEQSGGGSKREKVVVITQGRPNAVGRKGRRAA
jgi:uncharacterized protein (AIM24 family)